MHKSILFIAHYRPWASSLLTPGFLILNYIQIYVHIRNISPELLINVATQDSKVLETARPAYIKVQITECIVHTSVTNESVLELA